MTRQPWRLPIRAWNTGWDYTFAELTNVTQPWNISRGRATNHDGPAEETPGARQNGKACSDSLPFCLTPCVTFPMPSAGEAGQGG